MKHIKMEVTVTHNVDTLMAEFTLEGTLYRILEHTVEALEEQIIQAVRSSVGAAVISVRYTIITDQIITTLEEG